MEDKFYAVIDTNVIVSAVISKSLESNPAKIIRAIVQDRIVPLFNDEILDEYRAKYCQDPSSTLRKRRLRQYSRQSSLMALTSTGHQLKASISQILKTSYSTKWLFPKKTPTS